MGQYWFGPFGIGLDKETILGFTFYSIEFLFMKRENLK